MMSSRSWPDKLAQKDGGGDRCDYFVSGCDPQAGEGLGGRVLCWQVWRVSVPLSCKPAIAHGAPSVTRTLTKHSDSVPLSC